MSDFDIFWMESYANSDFAIATCLLFSLVVCGLEYRLQTSERPLLTLAYVNAAYAVFLWQVLSISEFIIGWRSHWLGGELTAIVSLPCVAFVVLWSAKRKLLSSVGVRFRRPNLVCALPLMVPLLPTLLLLTYVLALGANWRN